MTGAFFSCLRYTTPMRKPPVVIGADHAGFALKERLAAYLRGLGYRVRDYGARTLDPKDDYPDFAASVARAASRGKAMGIIVCGSSQGVCVAANKVRGVRAVAPRTLPETRLAREHIDANILCLTGWYQRPAEARKLATAFLTTRFSGAARHRRRLKKIAMLEKKESGKWKE